MPGNESWTADDVRALYHWAVEKRLDVRRIAEQFAAQGVKRTPQAVRRKLQEMRRQDPRWGERTLTGHIAPEWSPQTPPQPLNWRTILDAAQVFQRQRLARDGADPFPMVRIDSARPVAVCLTADWHLGSGATDHCRWRADIEYLLDTDGLYCAVLGDETDNVLTFKTLASVLDQVIPVDLQRELLRGVVEEMAAKGKLLFTTWSNHVDEFDERIAGQSLLAELRRTQGVPHLSGMGVVRLVVGEQEYTILATHKARYHSHLNALHGAKRLYQMEFPADVVAVAHDHQPGHEEYNHYGIARELGCGVGGTSWLVACSTYKTASVWAQRYFGEAVLKRETAVFWPDRHHIEVYDDAGSAMERIGRST